MQALVSKLEHSNLIAISFFNIQTHVRGNGTMSPKWHNVQNPMFHYKLRSYAVTSKMIKQSESYILCMLKYI